MPSNQDILKEIRENFDYAVDRWRPVRAEAATDRRYLSGDPWPPEEKAFRQQVGQERPCLVFDEFSQYTNQIINDVRQNKRAIEVDPEGDGATDKTARLRADTIRQIEYKSKAQMAYCSAFSGAVEGSYGYARITKRYVNPASFDQELRITSIPNPDTVYLDPDFVEADASDIKWAFILDQVRKKDFKKRFPKAETVNFSPEQQELAPAWIRDDSIQIAEYWKVVITKRTLLYVEDGAQGTKVFLDEIPDGQIVQGPDGEYLQAGELSVKIISQRKTETRKVCQYITNGVEILEKNDWDGQFIPIGACFGKEMYVDRGAGVERIFLSAIRLARDPAMALNYTRTSQMELAGQTPKTPAVGYEGQFENHEQEWQKAARVPVAFLQAKAITDATGDAILPLPVRSPYNPALDQLEMYAEACRRGIQAGMGSMPLPTAAQRRNEKSGVALKQIESQQAQGTYHFIDNYDRFLEHMGRMLDDLLDVTYDTAREIGTRDKTGDHTLIKINQPGEDGEPLSFATGEHAVTISVGPKQDSQREAADQFASQIASPELFAAAIAGNPKASKIVGLAVRLKNGGPIMDAIADVLDPEQGDAANPQQLQQALMMAQQRIQQDQLVIQELQQKADDNATKLKMNERDKMTELAKAERDSRTKREIAASSDRKDIFIALVNKGQEANLAVLEHEVAKIHKTLELQVLREQQAAQMGADAASQDKDIQASRDAQAADHAASMDQQTMGHQQALEQAKQAADLAPEPQQERE